MVTGPFGEDWYKSVLFILTMALHGLSLWRLKLFFKKWILQNPFLKMSQGL